MASTYQSNITLKEKKMIEKLENVKQALARFREKRRNEMGEIACKHGLDKVDNSILDQSFHQLAKELLNESQ